MFNNRQIAFILQCWVEIALYLFLIFQHEFYHSTRLVSLRLIHHFTRQTWYILQWRHTVLVDGEDTACCFSLLQYKCHLNWSSVCWLAFESITIIACINIRAETAKITEWIACVLRKCYMVNILLQIIMFNSGCAGDTNPNVYLVPIWAKGQASSIYCTGLIARSHRSRGQKCQICYLNHVITLTPTDPWSWMCQIWREICLLQNGHCIPPKCKWSFPNTAGNTPKYLVFCYHKHLFGFLNQEPA